MKINERYLVSNELKSIYRGKIGKILEVNCRDALLEFDDGTKNWFSHYLLIPEKVENLNYKFQLTVEEDNRADFYYFHSKNEMISFINDISSPNDKTLSYREIINSFGPKIEVKKIVKFEV